MLEVVRNGVFLALLALAATPARSETAPLRLGVTPVQAMGMTTDQANAVHAAVVRELLALGAVMPPEGSPLSLDTDCLDDPGCVASAAQGYGIDGIVATRVVKVGPVARITLGFFDGATGIRAAETSASIEARRLPGAFSPRVPLERGLQALRRLRDPDGVPKPPDDPVATVVSLPELPPTPDEQQEQAEGSATTDPGGGNRTPSALPMLGWAGAGVGGLVLAAGGAVGVWFLVLNQQKLDCEHNSDECSNGDYDEIYSDYEASGWAAPILMGTGITLAVAGITLALLGPGEAEEELAQRAPEGGGSLVAVRP